MYKKLQCDMTCVYMIAILTCMQFKSTPTGRTGSQRLRKRDGEAATVKLNPG